MCVELAFGNENISVGNEFDPDGRVIIQQYKPCFNAERPTDLVYWEGLIKQEDVSQWTKSGQWTRAEIFASKFNQRGRWYDVPSGQIIKGIALNTSERIILKIVTREAVGKETYVQNRFASTSSRQLVLRS